MIRKFIKEFNEHKKVIVSFAIVVFTILICVKQRSQIQQSTGCLGGLNGNDYNFGNTKSKCKILCCNRREYKIFKLTSFRETQNHSDVNTSCIFLGSNLGGFCLPKQLCHISSNPIIYDFSIDGDMSWGVSMSAMFDAPVYLFDPSPQSLSRFLNLRKLDFENTEISKRSEQKEQEYYKDTWVKEVSILNGDSSLLHFQNVGIWSYETQFRFSDLVGITHSAGNGERTQNGLVTAEDGSMVFVKSLKEIMSEYGHSKIDILKLDIKGMERFVWQDIAQAIKMLPESDYPKIIVIRFSEGNRNGIEGDNPTSDSICREVQLGLGYSLFSRNHNDFVFVREEKY